MLTERKEIQTMSAGGRLVVFGTNMVALFLGQNKCDSFSSLKLEIFTREYVGI